MKMNNPVAVLESAGVDSFHILWNKKTVQLESKQDLLRVMEQLGEPSFSAFAAGGLLFTTEKLVERFGAFR